MQQRETKPSDVLDADKTRLCLAGILLESVRDLSDSVRSPARQEASLGEQVEKLTLADPAENFTVGEMADSIGLNPGVFGKKFRKETGMSPADFVRRVKLEESVRLMREESRNVTETAYSLGFSSSQYFATIFKKYFGRTPKEFRKRG